MGIKLRREINDETDRGKAGDGTIPDGLYLVKVEEFGEQERKDKTASYYKGTYLIIDAEKEKCEGAIGLHIYDIFSQTDEAEWKLAKFADACYPPKFKGDTIDPDGKLLVVKVRTREFNGKDKTEAASYKSAESWKGVRLSTDDKGAPIRDAAPSGNSGGAQVRL